MKCKICGHRTNTIKAMREHYAKKHPAALRRRKKSASSKRTEKREKGLISKIRRILDEYA